MSELEREREIGIRGASLKECYKRTPSVWAAGFIPHLKVQGGRRQTPWEPGRYPGIAGPLRVGRDLHV